MAAEYEKIIAQLKDSLEKAKSMKFRAEAKLEQLNKQKQEIVNEVTALGLEPDNLDNEIEKLQIEIESLIAKARELLPTYEIQ